MRMVIDWDGREVDYDYVEVSRGLSQKGRLCRKYVIVVPLAY